MPWLAFLSRMRGRWLKLPKPLKIWLCGFFTWCAGLVLLAWIDFPYAWGIFLSFVRGEAAIVYWMGKVHLSQWEAVGIVIAASNANIYQYFWTADQLESPVKQWFRGKLSRLRSSLGIPPITRMGRAASGGKAPRLSAVVGMMRYFVLALYSFEPFLGVPLGVIFAKSTRTNKKTALAIMCAGNTLEKIAIGYLVRGILPLVEPAINWIVGFTIGVALTATFLRFLYGGNGAPQNATSPPSPPAS